MKLKLFFIVILFSSKAFCQDGKVQAIFDYKQFYTPYGATYIETYISFIASSLNYVKNKNGNLQSNIIVTQLIKKQNKIIDFKKYEVLGPELIDSIAVGFTDQKRFMLDPGKYELELEIMDLNDLDSTSTISYQSVEINFNEDAINISDIELIDYYKKTTEKNDFSKSGYDLYPLVTNYLPTEIEKLAYYFELYKKDSTCNSFLMRQYIQHYDTKEILDKYMDRSKVCLEKVKPEVSVFNIKKLPSGNYYLVVELRDKNNNLVTDKRLFFQRVNKNSIEDKEKHDAVSFNKLVTSDSIDEYISYLAPIAGEMERSIILHKKKGMTSQMKMNFFYNFWSMRNEANPKKEWLSYKAKVQKIDREYRTNMFRGYETDMGRVRLKYGDPNTIADRTNTSGKYPYQIWHYYHLEKANNVVFVFYKQQMIQQNFDLLHSNMPGEITNNQWQQFIEVDPSALDVNGNDVEAPGN